MFKKLLYLSFAVFMILFMWTVNTSVQAFNDSKLIKEVYLYKNSSESIIKNFSGIEFFVKGESIKIDNAENVDKILGYYEAQVVFTEKTEHGTSYYAFSKNFKYKKEINGKIINLHIFIGGNKTVIGSPIIYGSY